MQDGNQPRRRGRLPADEAAAQRAREIEALRRKVENDRRRLEELQQAQRKAEKSARRAFLNQRKFAFGGLAQIVGLLETDPGFVLGALLHIADRREPDGTWPAEMFQHHKQRGDAELAARAAARKQRSKSGGADPDDDED